MSPGAPLALRADACPEPEQLAAYIDGVLTPAERTDLERHLVRCADCREVVGETVEAAKLLPVVRPFPTRWVAAAAVLVAAAAVLFVVVLPRPDADPMAAIRTAVSGTPRTVEARLAGGFSYQPLASVTRGAQPAAHSEVEVTALRLQQQAAADSTPAVLHAAGSALLLAGRYDDAIAQLDRAAQKGPTRSIVSDRAAAYLTRGQRLNRPDDLVRALTDLELVIRDQATPEALFNRALALEGLNRRQEARDAWKAYLAADGTSAWANEARQHLDSLAAQSRVSDDDSWATPRPPR